MTFAGLIQKNRAVTSLRIPVISDIPVVGRLFRSDAESQTRRELLIFLTPHVMFDKADTDTLNYVESERMSWCLSDIVEMHGDVGMSGGNGLWGPAIAPTIYPDDNPTQVSPSQLGPTPAYEGGIRGEVVPGEIYRSNVIQGQTIDGQPIDGQPIEGHHLNGNVIEGVPLNGGNIESVPPTQGVPNGRDFGAQRLPRILPADGHPRTQTARAATPDRTSSYNQQQYRSNQQQYRNNGYDPRAVRPANYAPNSEPQRRTGTYGTILR